MPEKNCGEEKDDYPKQKDLQKHPAIDFWATSASDQTDEYANGPGDKKNETQCLELSLLLLAAFGHEENSGAGKEEIQQVEDCSNYLGV